MEIYPTTQKRMVADKVVFLLLSFPLGLCYFLLTVIGLAVSVSTLILWIGLPLLFATVVLTHSMAALERRMVGRLLHMPFPAQSTYRPSAQKTFLQRFGAMLRDPLTWTGMLYMLLKLPLGIISFILLLVLPCISMVLTVLPLGYLISLYVNTLLLKHGIASTSYIIPSFIEIHGQFDPVMFARSFIGIPVGILMWFVTYFLLKGLAHVSAELAHALLSPDETPEHLYTSFASRGRMQQPYAFREEGL